MFTLLNRWKTALRRSLEDVLLPLGVLPPQEQDELAVAHEQRRVVPVLLWKRTLIVFSRKEISFKSIHHI